MSTNALFYPAGSTAIAITSAATLAQAAAAQSAGVDNTSNLYFDVHLTFVATLAAGTPGSDKRIYIFAGGSEDGSNYGDNLTGSDSALTLRSPTNLRLIGTIETPDSGALIYRSQPFPVAWVFGGNLPRKWAIAVKNMTNLAFTAASMSYTGLKSSSA